ncbi:cyclic nucleotide-gated ion channel 1-like isoform X2 [Prunus dulcis]|uniref:cyclic nucleotide-gated ion channel 1-like isoform X2 n=1 Tax=Prunus dulcis TaxID=3755 RepID=UPI0014835C0B|nr:cyclic nucleotide-gated ion channel 1-like isoform X2 [Prunus dulcis]
MNPDETFVNVEESFVNPDESFVNPESFVLSSGKKPPARGEGNSASKKWPTAKEIFDPQGAFLPLWNKIFVIACVVAVSLDPLFFYIPNINEQYKCLGKDKKLRTTALLLRSLMDLTFVIHMAHQIRVTEKIVASEQVARRGKADWLCRRQELVRAIPWFSILVDFLAALPIPQVAIGVVFFKRRSFEYFRKVGIMTSLILFQYLPRVYRIYVSYEELTRIKRWVRGAFNFFLYILASHVLGGFWYFFSIQREISCWHQACQKSTENYCLATYHFHCDDFSLRNENMTSKSIPFLQKFFHSYWWGLRNLSNFGTNLETSNYVWENCFAILISVIGLLLFLYLIGNVQTYIQLATTKSEEICQKMMMKDLEIQLWMSRNGLPNDMKTVIMKNVKQRLEQDKDADVENLFSILSRNNRKSIKRHLCMNTLKKVPMLQSIDERVLKMICDHLKPVIYTENSYVIRVGEPLDLMLFITQGIIWTFTGTSAGDGSVQLNGSSSLSSSTSITKCLEKGDFYGEELLSRISTYISFSDLPICTENVKCHTKVEAFALLAKDLRRVVSEFWWYFPDLKNSKLKEKSALSSLRAVRQRNRSKKEATLPPKSDADREQLPAN